MSGGKELLESSFVNVISYVLNSLHDISEHNGDPIHTQDYIYKFVGTLAEEYREEGQSHNQEVQMLTSKLNNAIDELSNIVEASDYIPSDDVTKQMRLDTVRKKFKNIQEINRRIRQASDREDHAVKQYHKYKSIVEKGEGLCD